MVDVAENALALFATITDTLEKRTMWASAPTTFAKYWTP